MNHKPRELHGGYFFGFLACCLFIDWPCYYRHLLYLEVLARQRCTTLHQGSPRQFKLNMRSEESQVHTDFRWADTHSHQHLACDYWESTN